MQPPYLFDCNSFNVLSNYYPEQFPSFWEKFAESIAAGHILSCKEVLNELGRLGHNEWIRTWAKSQKDLFEPPTPDEGAFVAEIFKVGHFRQLVGNKQLLNGHPVADPFIVASARARRVRCDRREAQAESREDSERVRALRCALHER